MNHQPAGSSTNAREDWETRIGLRRGPSAATGVLLPAPTGLLAIPGRGQVTLDWQPVPGAIGYQVYRSDSADALAPLDHLGGDVLAVPHPPYADTTGEPGRTYRYTVAALVDIGEYGQQAGPVAAASLPGGPAEVSLDVDASVSSGPLPRPWVPMIGSEHLSHLLCTGTTGNRPIGAELAEALIVARDELGIQAVRAHAILGDDLGVYREVDGEAVHDFSRVDAVYDRLLELGLRPVVELSFMPADLASDPTKTVFAYRAVVSPPKNWDRWYELVRDLVAHLVERYGIDEVRHWPFEVWNEANLEVFWSGTRDEWLRLYDLTARAVKQVHRDLVVGGPASAAAGWIGDLLAYVERSGAPLDFISTHTYGSPPLDFRPLCARYGREDLRILWTEWGVTPTHFAAVNDSVFAAAFLLRGMRSAAGRVDALAYWVVSDHFEELGRPPRLMHGGFGLLTVGNLRKPRFWALALAQRLGGHELPASLRGDGASSLVQAWAGRHDDGRIGILVWNGTLDQSKVDGDEALARTVRLTIHGLPGTAYRLRHWRIDQEHSNVATRWQAAGSGDWPTDGQWAKLAEQDTLDEYHPETGVSTATAPIAVDFPLPMPGVSFVELQPA